MSSRLPIVSQISIISFVFQPIIILLLAAAFYQLDKQNYLVYSIVCFFLLELLLRNVIAHDHRKGMSLVRQHKFEQAIPYFERSYGFFNKHQWVDKYRFLTVLSVSRISFAEMALLNIAFCLAQIGRKTEAVAEYKKALAEFPDSVMAIAALKMME